MTGKTDFLENFSEPAGLYIHVPFCRFRCPYCDFCSTTDLTLIPLWRKSIVEEAKMWAEKFPFFDTLYFGGGTPSLLKITDLAWLMKELGKVFSFSPDLELTIETNPEDVCPSRMKELRAWGFNRISLGIQSLSDEDLSFLGRRHTAAMSERALWETKEAGFKNVSVDLMYGLANQQKQNWEKILLRLLKNKPEHISCYQLTIKEKTVFGRRQKRGEKLSATEERQEELFLVTSAILRSHGYLHYEVSNFAAGEDLKSRHNLKYWRRQPYLGLGPGAHSFLKNKRWWNVKQVKKYCQMVLDGQLPVACTELLSGQQEKLEKIFLGLRTSDGIPANLVSCFSGENFSLLEKKCFLQRKGDRIVPTEKGYLVCDVLPLWLSGDWPVLTLPPLPEK